MTAILQNVRFRPSSPCHAAPSLFQSSPSQSSGEQVSLLNTATLELRFGMPISACSLWRPFNQNAFRSLRCDRWTNPPYRGADARDHSWAFTGRTVKSGLDKMALLSHAGGSPAWTRGSMRWKVSNSSRDSKMIFQTRSRVWIRSGTPCSVAWERFTVWGEKGKRRRWTGFAHGRPLRQHPGPQNSGAHRSTKGQTSGVSSS